MKRFEALYEELVEKVARGEAGSGTVQLVERGVHAIGKKVLEEAGEVWLAAEYQDKEALAEEISQLWYHTQVMMVAKGIKLEDVYKYL